MKSVAQFGVVQLCFIISKVGALLINVVKEWETSRLGSGYSMKSSARVPI
jgi:hypothetical protein